MTRAVVIGAGHNGLAAAVALAQAGRRVTLLERRPCLGGQAAVEEFLPGYAVPGIVHDTLGLSGPLVDALGLEAHGLVRRESAPLALAPDPASPNGGIVVRTGDDDLPAGLYRRSPDDVRAWSEWRKFIAKLRPLVRELLDRRPPALQASGPAALVDLARPALALKRLGNDLMVDVLRNAPMCAWDHLKDRFADPLLAAFFASRGIEGGHLGPWSAGTAALLLLRECAATPGVLGGPAAFTDALVAAARAHEVELVTDAEVRAIRMDGARVAGVETADGRAFDASLVMSTVGVVQTFVGLLPRSACPVRVRTAAAAVRRRGSTAAVRLALSAPLRWRGIPQGVDGVIEFARTAPDMRALEQAFDCVKHRRWCDVPWLDVAVPSIARPALAPTGHASVSVLVHCASAELEGGWSAAHGERLRASVVDQLGRLTDGLADSIVGHEVLTPPELGDRYGLDGAHPMHAELDLAQLWAQRPSIRFARYDTPVPGLYLGGRATHPGADFPGTSGWLAAGAALADGR